MKNSGICEIQRDLYSSDRLNQHCVNLLGEGLNVMVFHLYVKVLTGALTGKKKD